VTPRRRPCLDCGALIPRGSRCADCQRPREAARNARRTHYAGDYRARAKAVRESAVVCWLCGEGAREGDPWQADHVVPGAPDSPLAPAHRACNARRGATPPPAPLGGGV
jgi:hypothetical protein